MYAMNLIQEICLTKNSIDQVPKWKIITRNKQLKKYNNYIYEFLNIDIFNLADNVISFLNCFDEDFMHDKIEGFIQFGVRFITIKVQDKDGILTRVLYLPSSNRFEVSNDKISYTIYRNTKISHKINNMWEPLTNIIKQRYLEIILRMVEYTK